MFPKHFQWLLLYYDGKNEQENLDCHHWNLNETNVSFTQSFFWYTSFHFCSVFFKWGKGFTISLGQKKDRVSISYFDVRFSFDLNYVFFRSKYDLSAIWNTPFIIPGAKSLCTLQISVASFYKFLWWTVNPLNASFALISKPVTWLAVQIEWLVSIWG